jgi:predicted transcriptional regulator
LPDQAAAIDAWIARQKDGEITRPEAIRRLVELGLKAKK